MDDNDDENDDNDVDEDDENEMDREENSADMSQDDSDEEEEKEDDDDDDEQDPQPKHSSTASKALHWLFRRASFISRLHDDVQQCAGFKFFAAAVMQVCWRENPKKLENQKKLVLIPICSVGR